MSLNSLSDKLVFKTLANIKVGYLEITDYEGKQLKFGNPEDSLKAKHTTFFRLMQRTTLFTVSSRVARVAS